MIQYDRRHHYRVTQQRWDSQRIVLVMEAPLDHTKRENTDPKLGLSYKSSVTLSGQNLRDTVCSSGREWGRDNVCQIGYLGCYYVSKVF
jgi:hypothetical protein